MTKLEGRVSTLTFGGQCALLKTVQFSDLDINTAPVSCLVEMPDGSRIAVSKWKTPKRTRTYPFARIYDTYSHNGKIVTVIPILKDEGSDTNNDRVNYITLSWMNLMNIYIVLAWYENATKKSNTRIDNQRLNSPHVSQKLQEISQYRLDAHHWNKQHFETEFVSIYEKAVASYAEIAQKLGVSLHSPETQLKFLKKVRSQTDPSRLDLEKFMEVSLKGSAGAAQRETQTSHRYEQLAAETEKVLICLRNNLGGTYYLTVDELIVEGSSVILQESKNSTRTGELPSEDDIKDGLFKLLLYKHIHSLKLNGQSVSHSVRLRITGNFYGRLNLPSADKEMRAFLARNSFSERASEMLEWLNRESACVGIPVLIEGNL